MIIYTINIYAKSNHVSEIMGAIFMFFWRKFLFNRWIFSSFEYYLFSLIANSYLFITNITEIIYFCAAGQVWDKICFGCFTNGKLLINYKKKRCIRNLLSLTQLFPLTEHLICVQFESMMYKIKYTFLGAPRIQDW